MHQPAVATFERFHGPSGSANDHLLPGLLAAPPRIGVNRPLSGCCLTAGGLTIQ